MANRLKYVLDCDWKDMTATRGMDPKVVDCTETDAFVAGDATASVKQQERSAAAAARAVGWEARNDAKLWFCPHHGAQIRQIGL